MMETATVLEQGGVGRSDVHADFPVTWHYPGDERKFWTMDPMHFPEPIRPLAAAFLTAVYATGFDRAAEHYDMPIRMRFLHINMYIYQSIYPIAAPPELVLKIMQQIGRVAPGLVNAIQNKAVGAQARKYLDRLNPVMERLDEYWENELLPEIKQHLRFWEDFDLRGATMPQLLAHLDATYAKAERLGAIHFLIGFPFLLAQSTFHELFYDLFGGEQTLQAFRLLQGFDNTSLEIDRALWQLSRRALAAAPVRVVLEEQASARVVPALESTAEGRTFLVELRAFLEAYGHRHDKVDTISEPSWLEDPAPVIKSLKDYVTQPERDLETERAALSVERERLIAEARQKLSGYPQPVVGQFEAALKAAQIATVLQEDHAFWIDQRGLYQIRRVLLECGRRLAEAGVIGGVDDVFYLTLDELRVTAAALPKLDRRQLVRDRMAEMHRFRTLVPPQTLGTAPLMAPPNDPMGRTIGKFFGTPVQASHDPRVLTGHAGSTGVVRGPARVVRSLAEASKLQPGDVLVAETTAPPWTPLFTTAAAVVTDTGGMLSHCAVVAREYRIPAVVGTGRATTMLTDGDLVEVDGAAGTVRRITPAHQ
jgi:pyruvate,water dikinase